MARYGVLERDAFSVHKQIKRIIKLGPNALPHLQEHYPLSVDRNTQGSSAIQHDLELSELVSYLSKFSNVKSIITENMLQSCGYYSDSTYYNNFTVLNSDAVLTIIDPVKTTDLAVEFDRTSKSEARYKEKIKSYYERTLVPGVFYFCSDERLTRLLKKIDKETKTTEHSKFYFHTMEDGFYGQAEVNLEKVADKKTIIKLQ